MLLLDGKPLSYDSAFTHEGIQYPANWLRLSSWEEKSAIGITEVPNPPYYDQRFYWGVDNPKQLEDITDEEGGDIDTIVGISINGIAFAQSLAGHIDADFAIFRSVDGDGSGHLSNKYGNVAGRNVAIIDDVLSTGSTMSKTIESLRSQGANVSLCMVLVNKTERNEIEGVPLRGIIRAVKV